jgi:membrane-bound lytic murein transglycosylase B
MYEYDQRSTIEILLAEPTLAGFFDNVIALESLNERTHQLLVNIKDLKQTLESQKVLVEDEKDQREREQIAAALAKQEQERNRQQADTLLRVAQRERITYEQYLQEVEAQTRAIRSRLLNLVGTPDAPTFGEALDMAQRVQELTGVRAAFLLAIVIQESALGRNVGQCNLADTTSGASVGVNTGRKFSNGIHPTRDLPPFLQITQETGRNPLQTPISCPLSIGYGGAMGPSQFIPSTWILYRNGVAQLTGMTADPWNVRDAFLGSGLLLRDNGAAPRTYSAEWCAAARYFSGSCSSASHVVSYANTVLARANCVQDFITTGNVSAQCERLVFIPQ